ncbi:hypothetical protein BDFB_013891 [Asbolus verrucosus]|uniref:Uncharacterized protein n=1 Tax=Asbolus verrucosus TaxID=1661398 RepID=A0A482VW13_ASBVE|nr:hypothetical protein BDFB_013891 [Asbolus verrucosus]
MTMNLNRLPKHEETGRPQDLISVNSNRRTVLIIIILVLIIFRTYGNVCYIFFFKRRFREASICLLALTIHFGLKYSGQDVESVSWIPVVSVMVFAIKLGLGFLSILLTFMKMMYHCIFLQ